MKQLQKAGGIVVNPLGQILVIKNQLGYRTLPKGSIKPGETPLQAARREIFEEAGLRQLKTVKRLGTIVRPGYTAINTEFPSVTKHIQIYWFSTDEVDLAPQRPDSIAAKWVSPSEVAKILKWPEEAAFFQEHRNALAG